MMERLKDLKIELLLLLNHKWQGLIDKIFGICLIFPIFYIIVTSLYA